MDWIKIESAAYWTVFVVAFLGFAIWESVRPKRAAERTERRWGKHGVMLIICSVISVGLWRVSPVVMAFNVSGSRLGLLSRPWLPFAVRCVIAILALDLVRYATHRLSHSVEFLWRVHQVHHSDPEFDVSTALRVHPVEVVWTQGLYLLAVALIAPPVVAVLLAELLSAFESFLSHANASLPRWVEKPLRWILVTPDMHRIHHSEEMQEQFRNLSDVFPLWDRLFGTYLATPKAGDERIVTGLRGCQDDRSLGIGFMLAQPFRAEIEQGPVTNEPRGF